MKGIMIVTGHGQYATSIKSSLEVLAGDNDEVKFIDFTEDDNDVTLKKKMQKVLDEYNDYQILFICDILGGTPFKTAVELSISMDNIEVVAGCNIGSIIEATFQKDIMEIGELADFIVTTSINSTMRFVRNVPNNTIDNSVSDFGI